MHTRLVLIASFFFLTLPLYAQGGASVGGGPLNTKVEKIGKSGTDHAGEKIKKQMRDIQRDVLSGPPAFSLVGKVERGRQTPYSINGEDFTVDSGTSINGDLQLGSFVEVSGDFVDGGKKIAKNVIIGEPQTQSYSSSASEVSRPGKTLR